MSVTMPAASEAERRDALTDRLFQATIGAFDLLSVYLGDRLGLYQALAEGAAVTPAELASQVGIAERYAREWLEHQAVGGILEVEDSGVAPESRRYRLPAGHAEALADPRSLATIAPMARMVAAAGATMPQLLDAYRSGDGVAWDAYGPDLVEAQAAINRPVFERLLPADWITAMPDVDARLREPGARVVDVACGGGWSTISVARAYPQASVDGIDLDPGSIDLARRNLAETAPELGDRVSFAARDAADPALERRYDLALILEAVHDLSRPVEVLRAVRGLLRPAGALLVADERVADTFTAPGDEVERLMYGYSILFCLANGLAERPSAATGTVMRADTLRRYATEAGFSSVTVLPVEHDTLRVYRLDP
jgi:2-polyprenyl-3-methyl-5-hydroxy-6-metoxy-1,4-benzoquinol methylase